MIESCAAIVIAAKHHELSKVKDTRGTTHTVKALRCRFEFRTADWDYSAKTAMFCNGDAILHPEVADSAINVPLDEDNECEVPYEVLTDALPYSIGVWGATPDGVRIVSRWLVFETQLGCYTKGNAPADPKPTIYEQILTTSQGAVNIANEVLDRANSGEFDGEVGPAGKDGVSPIIETSPIDNGYQITFTDAESTHTIILKNGEKGERGPQGETGTQGMQGDQGEKGDPGEKGDKGDKGDQGIQGIQGPQGAIGETGPQGIPGTATQWRINKETQYWEYTFVHGDAKPKEEDWVSSDLRAVGETGPAGEPGKDGAPGIQGEQGPKGDPGEKGADGAQGVPGKDGFTPFIGVNGNWWISDTDTGTKAEGVDGKDGQNGADGYTPVRGTDFWTDEDKAEIKSYVEDAILNGEW